MQVDIVEQPQLRVAAVRHIGPYSEISEAFTKLGALADEAGLFGPDTLMLGLYHDDPRTTAENELRSDAAVTIGAGVALPRGLTELIVPAGRYARTTHRGSYDGLPDAWARLMREWFPTSGERPAAGTSYELYRNDPTDTAPEDLVTEIYAPLA